MLKEQGILQKKIQIISNAIDKEEFGDNLKSSDLKRSLTILEDNIVVGTIGRLSPEKGHIFLVKAWPEIIKSFPEALLLIVGDGVCMNKLQKLTIELGITGSVLFVGFRSDGRRFFSVFDLMVLPSLDEGLPYVLLEAMICNVPVVATKVGEVPAVTKNGDLASLVKPGCSNAIAKSIINCLEHKDIIVDRTATAYKFILKNYSQKTRTNQIIDVYKQVLL
jgi:glycosyltransferase involved in cell wall biosynthesis